MRGARAVLPALVVVPLVVVPLVAVALVAVGTGGWDGAPLRLGGLRALVAPGAEVPPYPSDARPRPLGTPPEVPITAAPYSFLETQSGGNLPVAWDPCRPIHYVVRPTGAPPGGDQLLADALARVRRATGLVFVADGLTTEAPNPRRPAYAPDRYGRRWAPVLVTWSSQAETPTLAGAVVGQAGPSPYATSTPGTRRWVSGQLVLDAPDVAALLRRPDGRALARAIVQHELGHLVGLAHVPDRFQLMYAETTPLARDFASGDRQGLARLGAGQCFRDA